jgi:alkylation response protein AidB-like acyl-CoA dehydrogenase
MESVNEFRARAEQWLEGRAERRTAQGPRKWGEGEFSVVVFHDATDEEELAVLTAYQAWHREKLASGFGALGVSTEFGGAGMTKAHDVAFKELESRFEVARDHEVISVTSKLIAPTIEEYGTPEQRQMWCRPFFQVEEFCCQLFSEPGAGSDLAGLSCKAVRDGDEWVLDGQKVWTSTARISQWGFAICRTDPDVVKHAGMTAFMIRMDTPGLEIRPIKQMSGGASFNEVFLSGARVPDAYRIGNVGDGWKVALTVLAHERSNTGSGRRGGSYDELLMLTRHLERENDPLVRQSLARIYTSQRVRDFGQGDRFVRPWRVNRQAAVGPLAGDDDRPRWPTSRPVAHGRHRRVGHIRMDRARTRHPRLPHRRRLRRDPAQHHRRTSPRPPRRTQSRPQRHLRRTSHRPQNLSFVRVRKEKIGRRSMS